MKHQLTGENLRQKETKHYEYAASMWIVYEWYRPACLCVTEFAYVTTGICMVQSAFAILQEKEKLPEP